jgi:hypothetical protein
MTIIIVFGSPHHFDADPDSTYHPVADPDAELDPDPDPSFHLMGSGSCLAKGVI